MAFKLNNSDEYESLGNFCFCNFPKVWDAKSQELVNQGLAPDLESAKIMCAHWEFELELYYEEGSGAFAVESEAVESGTIYSPYSREIGEDADEC